MIKRIFKVGKRKSILFITSVILFIVVLFCLLYTPKIYLRGNKNVVLSYDKKYAEEGYKASFMGVDISNKVIVKDNINYEKIGKYRIDYKITNILGIFDNKDNRIVSIVDDKAPSIELIDEDVFLEIGQPYIEPGYKAIDEYDGDITEKVMIENYVDNKRVGKYEIIYRVSDSSLNETIEKRNVIVYENNVESIPILTYHNFMNDDEKRKYTPTDKYTMSLSAFEQQLKYLKDNGYNTITLDKFYDWYVGKSNLTEKDVVITIDDGNISAYLYAIPLLEKYDFKATIFVITGRITNEEQVWDPTKLKFFNNEMIEDIKKNHPNIHLASHTHYLHGTVDGSCAIGSKTEEEIYNDVKLSREVINSKYLAYPFGCNTEESREALKKAQYKMAFSFGDDKRASKDQDVYALKRININSYTTMQQFIKWLEV